MKNELLKKIETKSIVTGVVGLGYVGLPLAVEKAKAGFKTIGFDVQKAKVDMVNEGKNYIGDVVDSDLEALAQSGMLSATTDFSFIKDVTYKVFAMDEANNSSATIEFTIDTILPTITKIDDNLIQQHSVKIV